jgi:hypothetical protein
MNAHAPLAAFQENGEDWRSGRNDFAHPTVGSDFSQALAPLRFAGAATRHRLLLVPGPQKSFEEKIFDALVSLKLAVAHYAMHLGIDERARLFAELDDKINADDWHEDDKLPTAHSFVQFLKWMIFAGYHKWTSIGVSSAGTITVAWRTPRVLLTADFARENDVRWTVQITNENDEVGHTAGRCSLRLFSEQALFYLKR